MASLSAQGRIEHWLQQGIEVKRAMVQRLDDPPKHMRGSDAACALVMRGRAHWDGEILRDGKAPEQVPEQAPAEPVAAAEEPEAAPAEVTEQSADVAAMQGDTEQAFDCCVWLNGAVTMEGDLLLPSGHVVLTPENAEKLRQMLNRHYRPEPAPVRPHYLLGLQNGLQAVGGDHG